MTAIAVLIGVKGLNSLKDTNAGLETVYNDRVVPLQQLKSIADDYAVFIIDAANKANAGIVTGNDSVASIREARPRCRQKHLQEQARRDRVSRRQSD